VKNLLPVPAARQGLSSLSRSTSRASLSEGDRHHLVREGARLLPSPARRRFLAGGGSVGGLALLAGCSATDSFSAETLLMRISRFNDRGQGWLVNPDAMAPTYAAAEITRPFPFNAFYSMDQAPQVDGGTYRLQIGGKVERPGAWTLERLAALPQEEQITRHICVEGWSAIGRWGGVPFARFLQEVGADTTRRYVGFRCADEYYTSIDMATALHRQTLLALSWDGQTLPREFGYPMKLRMPTKLGYKNPKHIVEIFVTDDHPGGYWEDQGYNWFGGA